MAAPARVILSTALVFSVLLAACGGNDASSGGDSASGEASGQIEVWGMEIEGEAIEKLAADFMKENPDIEVDVNVIGWDVAHDKLLTSVAGDETPDVSMMGTTWMGEFANQGALAEVPDSIDEAAFFDSAWETVVFEGTPQGAPFHIDTRVLYYRTDVAKRAGFEDPPETWEDMQTMAKAMTEEGGAKYGIYLMPNNWQEFLPELWQAGGAPMEGEQFSLDSPEAVEALEFHQWFFDQGLVPPTPAEGYDPTQPFVDGDVPMFFSGPWHVAIIEDTGGKSIEGKWDVAPMPQNESGTSFVGGSDLVVYNQSDNQPAAWEFVEYLTSPEVQAKFHAITGDLPAAVDAWAEGGLAQDEHLQVFKEQMGEAEAPPVIPTWEQVAAEAIAPGIEQATIGDASAQEAAASMQEKATSIGID
ncbi:MAG: sugar ABC transporter substrate-binding protein [Actinomycetota bacterium]|nr:sugar ABC transporter substrate-binding protein [Actinomycetota bacterium]